MALSAMIKHINLGLILSTSLIITACGGGGGDKKSPASGSKNSSLSASQTLSSASQSSVAPTITTPGAFSFTDKTGAADCEFIESDAVTITDITVAVSASVTGGSFAINHGEFLTDAANVNAGDSIKLRVACSDVGGEINTATLTVGGVSASFKGTTAPDLEPDVVIIPAIDSALLGAEYVSEAVTITGINTPIAISVIGGEYAIDDGEFTQAPAQISNGQTIKVRAAAPTIASGVDAPSTHTVVLSLGETSVNFNLTALVDSTAPVAEFMFPPPMSMTEGTDIYTRIKITDDLSQVSKIFYSLNDADLVEIDLTAADVETITHDDGALEVRKTFPLENAKDNTLKIFVEDAAGNRSEITPDASVMVRQDVEKEAFPRDDMRTFKPHSIALHKTTEGDYLYMAGENPSPDNSSIKQYPIYKIDTYDLSISLATRLEKLGEYPRSFDIFDTKNGTELYIHGFNLVSKVVFGSDGVIESDPVEKPTYINREVAYRQDGENIYAYRQASRSFSLYPCGLLKTDVFMTSFELVTTMTLEGVGPYPCITGTFDFNPTDNSLVKFYGDIDVVNRYKSSLFKIYLESGETKIISGSIHDVGHGVTMGIASYHKFIDPVTNSAVISSSYNYKFLFEPPKPFVAEVNIADGGRRLISDSTTPSPINDFDILNNIENSSDGHFIYGVTPARNSIMAIDRLSGHRVFIFKAN